MSKATFLSAQLRESAPYLQDAGWREIAKLIVAAAEEIESLLRRPLEMPGAQQGKEASQPREAAVSEPNLHIEFCNDGAAAEKAIKQNSPDMALARARPEVTGRGVLGPVKAQRLSARVIVPADAGRVAAGGNWPPHDLAALESKAGRRLQRPQSAQGLTNREREVMRLVTSGLSNKQVARRLNLSEGTVKIHLHNIYKKVGVANRTSLAAAIAHENQRTDGVEN